MIKLRRQIFFLFFLFLAITLGANETKDGYIRMLINERTGRFSLSYLSDPEKTKYSQLIYRSGNTSFLDININGIPYRLGETRVFTTRVDREEEEPVVIYDSDSISVKMIFSPVKTVSSPNANGIRITIKITNNAEDESEVGLRFLIDTVLGEGRKNIPFVTENFSIKKEKIIENSPEVKYWISRGKDISLMGSIADPLDETAKGPDYLHFANWQKLSDVPWKAPYHDGRSFNKLPYSIGDSAVSYYWNPVVLEMGKTLSYTVYLTTEDTAWYQQESRAAPKPVQAVKEKKPEEKAEPAVVVLEPQVQAETSENIIAVIEQEAQEVSQRTGEDFNVTFLRMMQNRLSRLIAEAEEIPLNKFELQQMDNAIKKYRQNKDR